jgi:hypothetical protein
LQIKLIIWTLEEEERSQVGRCDRRRDKRNLKCGRVLTGHCFEDEGRGHELEKAGGHWKLRTAALG